MSAAPPALDTSAAVKGRLTEHPLCSDSLPSPLLLVCRRRSARSQSALRCSDEDAALIRADDTAISAQLPVSLPSSLALARRFRTRGRSCGRWSAPEDRVLNSSWTAADRRPARRRARMEAGACAQRCGSCSPPRRCMRLACRPRAQVLRDATALQPNCVPALSANAYEVVASILTGLLSSTRLAANLAAARHQCRGFAVLRTYRMRSQLLC